MFCPDIKRECVRERCREWNKEMEVCNIILEREARAKSFKDTEKLFSLLGALAEAERISTARVKMSLHTMLSLPISPEDKEIIQSILQAPTAEVAEDLLKGLGLS